MSDKRSQSHLKMTAEQAKVLAATARHPKSRVAYFELARQLERAAAKLRRAPVTDRSIKT